MGVPFLINSTTALIQTVFAGFLFSPVCANTPLRFSSPRVVKAK
ncbi:secreted protein [methanotrophic bacterial endosymbiont of Bathymodiolus sp.]|nr:secreted protein [methanotrophic bacterial endosymbiont of Bathymodiolus sp.]